jgi:3-oxoacyl-[acyl-carrier-protein] synthase-3
MLFILRWFVILLKFLSKPFVCSKRVNGQINLKIIGTGIYQPEKCVDNKELLKTINVEEVTKRIKDDKTPEEFIRSYYGISSRYVASDHETNSFMGAEAIKKAISNASIDIKQIDLLIYASTSIDKAIPDTSTRIHKLLKMNSTPSMSVHSTCLSFLHALNIANSFIKSQTYRTICIVSSEKPSVFANPSDPKTCVTLGDMASAVIVTASTNMNEKGEAIEAIEAIGNSSRVELTKFNTFSELTEMIELNIGNSRHSSSKPYSREDFYFRINSSKSLIDKVPTLFKNFISSLIMSNYKYVVTHQPSKIAVDHVKEIFGESIVIESFDKVGNIVSASIPYNLHNLIESGKIKRGEGILLVGVGAGLGIGIVNIIY